MKIKFSINYATKWGQNVKIWGSIPELGDGKVESALWMDFRGGETWEKEIEVKNFQTIEYKYFIFEEGCNVEIWEWGKNRVLHNEFPRKPISLKDFWRPTSKIENIWNTSPFTKAFFKPPEQNNIKKNTKTNLRFQIQYPKVDKKYTICIIGNTEALGNWDEKKALPMDNTHYPFWKRDIFVDTKEDYAIEYKYALYDTKYKQIVAWEWGVNRSFYYNNTQTENVQIINDESFRYTDGFWKASGVAVPLFSLRSQKGLGVGEFTDINLLTDWAAEVGFKIIQILPINDTTAQHNWKDSYPYAGISVFALHPLYAHIEDMGEVKNEKRKKELETAKKLLNQEDTVAYEEVMKVKHTFFRYLYQQEKNIFLQDTAFIDFFQKNKEWLIPYAAFCYLRDSFQTPDFNNWAEYSQYDEKKIQTLCSPKHKHYDDIAIHYFIQFHLDKQLRKAVEYARNSGIVLKGDIPIGIYRFSCDAWVNPTLYNLHSQAGAPPDDFSITGQNWGFPTYNWTKMEETQYKWWKERLQKMSDYFDIFRIDHILGFFRIWEIPMHAVEGLLGKFSPCIPLSIQEMEQRGLHFQYHRYCFPYIRDYMLAEIFYEHSEFVKNEFLYKINNEEYHLKPEYKTQKQVKQYITTLIQAEPYKKEHYEWLCHQLYRLHTDVLFIEDEASNGTSFNPRIALHSTYSYKDLSDYEKYIIDTLYIDYFYKRHNEFWKQKAYQKLPILKECSEMLICGEDLGMVPECVPQVMEQLQMLNLAVQRMPNNPKIEFWHPSDTPYLSVTTTSTHDMSPIRSWWEENRQKTQRFYNTILGNYGEAPQFCEPWIVKQILNQHFFSQSMLAIVPMQDIIALDMTIRKSNPHEERVNIPAIAEHYWKYRIHIPLENLLKEKKFNNELQEIIKKSQR
ncbi:MAG: 4-alpha-glucanotransferase [Chitinophagaceae bacterium]|nr:4-alpha-glucanotransferase [Chitinophagaceae bacterium]